MVIATLLEVAAGSPWTYAVVTGSIAGSAVFPPLPSESMLVTTTSLGVGGHLNLVLVCLATTAGAVLGDLAAYGLGRSISARAQRRAARSSRGDAALQWLRDHESSWGPGMIMAGRFVPGGTTAVGVSAGLLAYPIRQFLTFAFLGAMLWTGYGVALAFLGQAAFPGTTWAGTVLAVGLALAIGAVVAAVRGARGRDRRR